MSQTLQITVHLAGESEPRQKTYSDHTAFLRDVRAWREYAEKRNLRFDEETRTTLRIGAQEGPLFDQSDQPTDHAQ